MVHTATTLNNYSQSRAEQVPWKSQQHKSGSLHGQISDYEVKNRGKKICRDKFPHLKPPCQ